MRIHKLDWLDTLTLVLCVWFVFYPNPYKILFTIILCLPIIGLIVHGHSKPSLTSLITITSGKDGGTDYETADFLVLPAIILSLRMLLDFEIESFLSLLIRGTIAFLILLVMLRLLYRNIEKGNKHRVLIYFVILTNVAIYSFAAVYGINCVYDKSNPKIYRLPVVNKSIYKGRHTTYYLKVKSWRKENHSEEISVTKDQYNTTRIGDTVKLDRQQGLLEIPWHFVE